MKTLSWSTICWAAVAVLAFSASTYCAIIARYQPLPQLRPNPEVLDFGHVQQHETVKAKLHIENHSGVEAIIRDIKTSCSCTAASQSDGPVGPRSKKEISVEWNSGNRRGFVRDTVILFLEEPATGRRGMMSIPIVATVISDVTISPESLSFSRDSPAATAIEIRGESTGLRVSAASSPSLALSVEIENNQRILVGFDPSRCPADMKQTMVIVQFEGAESSRARIPVTIR